MSDSFQLDPWIILWNYLKCWKEKKLQMFKKVIKIKFPDPALCPDLGICQWVRTNEGCRSSAPSRRQQRFSRLRVELCRRPASLWLAQGRRSSDVLVPAGGAARAGRRSVKPEPRERKHTKCCWVRTTTSEHELWIIPLNRINFTGDCKVWAAVQWTQRSFCTSLPRGEAPLTQQRRLSGPRFTSETFNSSFLCLF